MLMTQMWYVRTSPNRKSYNWDLEIMWSANEMVFENSICKNCNTPSYIHPSLLVKYSLSFILTVTVKQHVFVACTRGCCHRKASIHKLNWLVGNKSFKSSFELYKARIANNMMFPFASIYTLFKTTRKIHWINNTIKYIFC